MDVVREIGSRTPENHISKKEKIKMLQKFNDSIEIIENKIKYSFQNKTLLRQAFTRSSYSAEHSTFDNNEALEFFGDKVLDLVITKKLAKRYGEICTCYPHPSQVSCENEERAKIYNDIYTGHNGAFQVEFEEGELSQIRSLLVRSETLAEAIGEQGLQEYLLMGKGDIKRNVQNEVHVKEDLFEAILGAAAIDSDWNIEQLTAIVDALLHPEQKLDEGLERENYINLFQEWWQKQSPSTLPPYKYTPTENGYRCDLDTTDLHKVLTVLGAEYRQCLSGLIETDFFGYGKSKTEATMRAAKEAYLYVKKARDAQGEIIDLVGVLDINKAINQLQELYQHKYIGKPTYEFKEGEAGADGNPVWWCTCRIEGTDIEENIGDTTKMAAKKGAAWFSMMHLLNNTYERK